MTPIHHDHSADAAKAVMADLPRIEDMADALGFDPPAGLIERTPREEMLPLEETEEGSSSDLKPAENEEPTEGTGD